MAMRYDEKKSVYRDCTWCGGRGCLACESEASKAYKAAFPEGPKPIAVFKSPEEIDAARATIGIEALQKAFGAGGGGIAEIIQNIAKVKGEA